MLGAGLAQGSEPPERHPRGCGGRQEDALRPESTYFILLKGTPVIALVQFVLLSLLSALRVSSGQVSSQHRA